MGHSRLRNALVIVQVALSLVLLTTAGLFLRSLGNASSIDIGFKPDNLLIMTIDPKLQNYSHEKTVQFLTQLRERVSALPGVRSVSFVGIVPLSLGSQGNNFDVEATKDHPKQTVEADVNNVGSGYFQTMGIPLLRGRDFNLQTDDQHMAIINETMAANLFPGPGSDRAPDAPGQGLLHRHRRGAELEVAHHWREADRWRISLSQCGAGKGQQLLRNHHHREDRR